MIFESYVTVIEPFVNPPVRVSSITITSVDVPPTGIELGENEMLASGAAFAPRDANRQAKSESSRFTAP